MARTCEVLRPGRVPYAEAWALQKRLAREVAAGQRPEALILLEHPHTYTLGRSGHAEHLLWSEAERAARGVEVHWVDRGGDVTYHGPGQLVGYPIINLRSFGDEAEPQRGMLRANYVEYVRRLEEVLIGALASFGVVAGQMRGLTGVWVQPDVASRCPHCPPAARKFPSKIASIGVKVDVRGVTQHGFALNVDPDLAYFDGIVACGLKDAPAVSLAQFLPEPPPMCRVMDEVAARFGSAFGYEMVDQPAPPAGRRAAWASSSTPTPSSP